MYNLKSKDNTYAIVIDSTTLQGGWASDRIDNRDLFIQHQDGVRLEDGDVWLVRVEGDNIKLLKKLWSVDGSLLSNFHPSYSSAIEHVENQLRGFWGGSTSWGFADKLIELAVCPLQLPRKYRRDLVEAGTAIKRSVFGLKVPTLRDYEHLFVDLEFDLQKFMQQTRC